MLYSSMSCKFPCERGYAGGRGLDRVTGSGGRLSVVEKGFSIAVGILLDR